MSFNLSLDITPPKCLSLDVCNFKTHVTILSPWVVNALCLENRAATFAAVFGGYNLQSLHFKCLCLLFSTKWVNFPITVDLLILLCIWNIDRFSCWFLESTQCLRSIFLHKLTSPLFQFLQSNGYGGHWQLHNVSEIVLLLYVLWDFFLKIH